VLQAAAKTAADAGIEGSSTCCVVLVDTLQVPALASDSASSLASPCLIRAGHEVDFGTQPDEQHTLYTHRGDAVWYTRVSVAYRPSSLGLTCAVRRLHDDIQHIAGFRLYPFHSSTLRQGCGICSHCECHVV